ncbi:carboxymuconolactone decarboxylase family protein [Planotetraspora kaengkrachanensis]|uniref:Alkyl hydroperoxide reductase AhpD n=1 Tax=Planotetraspora kaengkrachanensis TaxID=575193 RepID=A0A8J3PVN9_9ACTN|nr:carboxymuconolactone decarboxylase family protein [Planotetraspora kaengkrachanensis]GIG81934.1 alkyl hydroperoxide reductase AhpD [Planotetraspora kaengkrachanensis]
MPTPFRYVTPTSTETATGQVGEVYRQLADDFGLARMPLFMTLSPAPDLLAATWAMLRESLVAGDASRTDKEVVAVAVSLANRCPFCVDAHTMLLHATGAHELAETVARGGTPADPRHARLLAWGMATRTPHEALHEEPPFPAGLAAEHIGTALTFHFINRMVSALLTDDLLPGGVQRWRVVRRAGGRAVARTTRRRQERGRSLPLLRMPLLRIPMGPGPSDGSGLPDGSGAWDGSAAADGSSLWGGPAPAWTAGSSSGTAIAAALAALRAAAGRGGALLSAEARQVVETQVKEWDGAHPPLAGGWPSGQTAHLPEADRPAARLALLAAVAPYRIADADVAAWRSVTRTATPDGDADLVRLLAYGAITAVNHIEAGLSTAARA